MSRAASETLIVGDALATMRTLPDESFDVAITSPPYNLGGEPWPHLGNWKPGDGGAGSRSKWRNGSDACGGVQYADHEDSMPWPEYVRWQHECLREMWRLLSPTGVIFYNHKPRVVGGRCWLPLELNPGLPLRQVVIWARAGGLNFNPTAYVPTHEWVMVLAKEGWRLKSKGASGVGDVWLISQESNPLHPAPFPVELPRRILSTIKAKRCLDPFCGSGTVGVACVGAGVEFVGIDKSERYIGVARARIGEARGVGGLFPPLSSAALYTDPA